jgi:uncharacterized protein YndB with AHSA1/START domain
MRVRAETYVAAPPDKVYTVYADYRQWPQIFETIRGVRVVGHDERRVSLAVDHAEGRVRNDIILLPPDRIVLTENKRAYDAAFVNTFRASGRGTRFEVEGEIRLKGVRRLLGPLIRTYARRQMKRLQLAPVKAESERRLATDPPVR